MRKEAVAGAKTNGDSAVTSVVQGKKVRSPRRNMLLPREVEAKRRCPRTSAIEEKRARVPRKSYGSSERKERLEIFMTLNAPLPKNLIRRERRDVAL